MHSAHRIGTVAFTDAQFFVRKDEVIYILFGFLLVITACFLILIVLLQRGRGGGLAGALGGMGGQSAFGAKAGDLFTRITIGVAAFWILLCITAVKVLSTPGTGFAGAPGAGTSGGSTTATGPIVPGTSGTATTATGAKTGGTATNGTTGSAMPGKSSTATPEKPSTTAPPASPAPDNSNSKPPASPPPPTSRSK